MKISQLALFGTSAVLLGACFLFPRPVVVTQETVTDLVEKAGFEPYTPFRSNWGPGFLYTGDLSNPNPVCPNVYGNQISFDDLENPDLVFQDIKQDNENSFSLTIGFLEDLLGDENSAKLSLGSVANSNEIDLKWGPVKEYTYYESSAFEDGKPRPIHIDCLGPLRVRKANGTLEEVKIITRAMAVKSLSFSAASVSSGEGGLDVTVGKALDASLGDGKWKYKDDRSLEINSPMILGTANSRRLVDFAETLEVSGSIARISLELSE